MTAVWPLAPLPNHHSPAASSGATPLRNVITSTPDRDRAA